MTIDKIQHYMQPIYFNHWIGLSKTEEVTHERKLFYMQKALKKLTYELDQQILSGIEFVAEQNLLIHLLK
jgi:desulfoferrodoxin (superoxide reductase-like protein)